MGAKRTIIWIVVAVVVLGLGVVGSGIWFFFNRPLKVFGMMERSKLKKAGFEQSVVTTPDGRMTVWQAGDGPTMVLLHGAGDQAGAWAEMAGPLLGEYRIVIPDLPGHLDSDPKSGPLGVDQVLAGVEALLDTLGDEPAILVGNSLGAWISMLVAHRTPNRVERIVAVNGGAILEPDPKVNLYPKTREEARETLRGLTGPSSPEAPGFVLDDVIRHSAEGPAGRLAQTADQMGPYLLDDRLHEITTPVDLVWGDADELLDLDYAQRLLDGLPQARLHVLKGCGHVAQRECPGEVRGALRKALAEPHPPVEPAGQEAVP
jgi:pimeloyl-ACP methyl ester carboxylesterase